MKQDFMDRAAKIMAEIRTRTCIDKIDEEVIFEILQAEFKNYYNAGYNAGYDAGYDELCWESYADGKSNAYDEGYDEGYYQGYSDRRSA